MYVDRALVCAGNEKRVSFSECVKVTEVLGDGEEEEQEAGERVAEAVPVEEATGEVDEEKIDYLMHMLHEADPTGERPDDPQLPSIESKARATCRTELCVMAKGEEYLIETLLQDA